VCGVEWSSDGSLNVMQENGILCSRRRSSMATQEAGAALSVGVQPSANSTDNCITSFISEQNVAERFDVPHDNAAVQSVPETSRRSSATVDVNCSVVDTVSRNRCGKMHTGRRKSMNEAAMTDFSVAVLRVSGFENSSESCQRSAWRRTKSYDMSGYELTVL